MEIAHVVKALNTGELTASMVDELRAAAAAAASPVYVSQWEINYASPNLIQSCSVVAKQGIILGVGLLAFSADGETLYFGSYCATENPGAGPAKSSTALPTGSTALFNPQTNGNSVRGVVYGEVRLEDGKLVPFNEQQVFTV